MNFSSLSAPLSILLSALLAASPIRAQIASTGQGGSFNDLQIRVSGDALSAFPGSRQASPIAVQVLDAAGTPVSDAAVAVRLPEANPSGVFPDGSHSFVAYTDATGKTQIAGIQWGDAPGTLSIRLTATKGASHAGTLLEVRLGAPELAAPPATIASRLAIPAPSPSSVMASPAVASAAEHPPHPFHIVCYLEITQQIPNRPSPLQIFGPESSMSPASIAAI